VSYGRGGAVAVDLGTSDDHGAEGEIARH
jgi:hypothetical protein